MPTIAPQATDANPAASEIRAPHDDATEDVAAEGVDAEPVSGRGSLVQAVVVEEVLGVERRDPRRCDGDGDQQDDERTGDQGDVLTPELAPELEPRRANVGGCERNRIGWRLRRGRDCGEVSGGAHRQR